MKCASCEKRIIGRSKKKTARVLGSHLHENCFWDDINTMIISENDVESDFGILVLSITHFRS